MVRGIRGATTVSENREQSMLAATKQLLEQIIAENQFEPEAVAHVFITVTHDLDATFPAKAVRNLAGWNFVPVMCSQEIPVPNSLEKCIRILLTVNTDEKQTNIQHVYLEEAKKLRPDLQLTNNQ